ncbi:hypothetical protein BX666DRAFT_1026736 [Dichotomocladium elegans]|nr:hypothetical protein BX666DRAFT_1026736 [Dichotomocladium elegans]
MSSSLGLVFVAHAVVHGLLGISLLFAPQIVESLISQNDAGNLFFVRIYGAAILGAAATSLVCFNLPDILPCKRATAMGLMVYHAAAAYLYFSARKEAIFPYWQATGAVGLHICFLIAFYFWYKITEKHLKSFTKQQRGESGHSHHH